MDARTFVLLTITAGLTGWISYKNSAAATAITVDIAVATLLYVIFKDDQQAKK